MVSDALSLDLMMAHGNDGAMGIKGEGGGYVLLRKMEDVQWNCAGDWIVPGVPPAPPPPLTFPPFPGPCLTLDGYQTSALPKTNSRTVPTVPGIDSDLRECQG